MKVVGKRLKPHRFPKGTLVKFRPNPVIKGVVVGYMFGITKPVEFMAVQYTHAPAHLQGRVGGINMYQLHGVWEKI
jgi:hypothetical protein